MIYNTLKILHIISATLLVTGLVHSYHLWKLSATEQAMQTIQTQNWLVIIPFAFFQLLTGFTMISLKHYSMNQAWIVGSVIGFFIVMLSWLAFMFLLLTRKYRKLQGACLAICVTALAVMIFCMANQI